MPTVKEKLYSKLSYTNLDYKDILSEIADIFDGSDDLGSWGNISQSDIMFITMSLLAAHKDMLNYMVDYRILESYLSTAQEWSSIVRIANSFGYKIGSYRPAKASIEVSSTLDSGVTLKSFSQLSDDSGISWVYVGEDMKNIINGDELVVYQGIPQSLDFKIDNINSNTNTHQIPAQNVAIGNNYNSLGCSKLVITKEPEEPQVWQEVANIYEYTGSDKNVYELNVDTNRTPYIRFLQDVDFSEYDGFDFTLHYLVTQGSAITNIVDDITGSGVYESEDLGITFTFIDGTFVNGSNPPETRSIREGFKRYYPASNSLVTLDDYRNYILYKQKLVLGITKCLVQDKERDTLGGDGDDDLAPGTVEIYALKGSTTLTSDNDEEKDQLVEAMNGIKVSGITINFKDPTSVDVTIKLTSLPSTGSASLSSLISDYINSKDIGEGLSNTEISRLILDSDFSDNYTLSGTDIQIFTNDGPVGKLTIENNQYMVFHELTEIPS